jgi:hypothetical protein
LVISRPRIGACPEIESLEDEVRIGEAGNLTVLTKKEWNVLVELIRSGDLGIRSHGFQRRDGGCLAGTAT